jgi:hypothetical protein
MPPRLADARGFVRRLGLNMKKCQGQDLNPNFWFKAETKNTLAHADYEGLKSPSKVVKQ